MNVNVKKLIATATLALGLASPGCVPLEAHFAPSGWEYPFECCSGRDCHPTTAIIQGGGYFLPETGETIPAMDSRVRESGDGEYHRCGSATHTRCLFVPLTA